MNKSGGGTTFDDELGMNVAWNGPGYLHWRREKSARLFDDDGR